MRLGSGEWRWARLQRKFLLLDGACKRVGIENSCIFAHSCDIYDDLDNDTLSREVKSIQVQMEHVTVWLCRVNERECNSGNLMVHKWGRTLYHMNVP